MSAAEQWSAASFDEERRHRFSLTRVWADVGPFALWIGQNPSKAGEVESDPTIRKEIGFSKRFGCTGLIAVNLGSQISTDPKRLDRETWVHPSNDVTISDCAGRCSLIIAAWGDLPPWQQRRAFAVLDLLRGREIFCIGKTKSGAPRHPSRAPYIDAPIIWREAGSP